MPAVIVPELCLDLSLDRNAQPAKLWISFTVSKFVLNRTCADPTIICLHNVSIGPSRGKRLALTVNW